MAEELLRSKHAFGNLENLDVAIATGKIDAYDILFLNGDTDPKIGWLDKNGIVRIVENECVFVVEDEVMPESGELGKVYIFNDEGYFWNGKEFVNFCKPTDLTEFEGQLNELKTTVLDIKAEIEKMKKDISDVVTDVSNIKTDVSDMKETVSEINEEVSSIQGKVSDIETDVSDLRTEVERKANADEVEEQIEQAKLAAIDSAEDYANAKAEDVLEEVSHIYEKVKYEIADTPVGTLVDYKEKEIRVMCPENAVFNKQNVGAGGDANNYYMTFKTYAPSDEAVGYIEHLGDKVDAEILTNFSTDKYGRRYQPTWLSLAKYDEATGAWNYYGKDSTVNKYIGWDYQIDWYDANGVMIASDSIRINLSNEACHYVIEPYYVSTMINEAVEIAKAYADEQIAEKVSSAFTIVEF